MLTKIIRTVGSPAFFRLLTVGLIAAIIAIIPMGSTERHTSYVHAPSHVRHSSALVDCEDFDVQPCWTYDSGAYRVVYSYQPYASKIVTLCPAKLTDAAMPCLARGLNRLVPGEHVVTRAYHWGRHF